MTWYLNKLYKDFDDVFDRYYGGFSYGKKSVLPLELNLAGYKRDEVDVNVKDGILYIDAKNEKYGSRTYSCYLDADIDVSTISCSLDLGILRVDAEKIPEKVPKKIQVK